MLTTKQTAAARELCSLAFDHSDAIGRYDIGMMTGDEYAAYRRGLGSTVTIAEDAFDTLTRERLPSGPLGLVIEETAREIIIRLNASDAGRSIGGAVTFQAASVLSLACGLSEV